MWGTDFAIRTTDLTKRFGGLLALDHLNLSIPRGSIFGLLGPNGAGKSTTIKMLTTLLPPTSGQAEVAGYRVDKDAREVRRHVGYVPQAISADGSLSAYENLLIFAKLYGVPRPQRRERIEELLNFVALFEVRHNLVRTYSGGMIRRLEIALALLHHPQILFLDEPTVGLDPNARRGVWEHILHLRGHSEITVLLTTHQMSEAEELCDSVGFLSGGKLQAIGSPAELKSKLGPDATLEEVFAAYAEIREGGGYKDVARTRRTAKRLN